MAVIHTGQCQWCGHSPKFWIAWAVKNNSQALTSTILQAKAWASVQTLRQDTAFRSPHQGSETRWHTFPRSSTVALPASRPFGHSSIATHGFNWVERLSTLLYCVLVKVFESPLSCWTWQLNGMLSADTLAPAFLKNKVCFKYQPRFLLLFFNGRGNGKPKILNLLINLALKQYNQNKN